MKTDKYQRLISIFAFFLFFIIGLKVNLLAQDPSEGVAKMSYYLPKDVSYDESIPTPEDVLHMVPGEWHVNPGQILRYMKAVAEASDRVTVEVYARTYENRPLLLLTITSSSNQQNIEKLRKQHLALTDPDKSGALPLEEMPIVVNLGYSVHGNEPSGANASLLTVYYLAAAQGEKIDKMLDNTIILVDPMLNPDGLARFADWVNSFKSKNLVTDPNNMEQNHQKPQGRTNHYWFDLNRDWMWVQHPASQGRIRNYHKWKPNILTDHHEMGKNSTFFFQPGIPSRTHPLTSELNQKLTEAISTYHVEAFNKGQRLYFSREAFDDFYYGKGSAYPDINGGIGILFEQGSSRSHAQETVNGIVTFPFTIKNQFMASLSTLKAANELRVDILNYQRDFYIKARQEAQESQVKAYVFGLKADRTRGFEMAKILRRHKIKVYNLAEDLKYNSKSFSAEGSYIVPTNQQQYRFITALFKRRTEFTDSLFYDVSTWTMPYEFSLPFAELSSYNNSQLGELVNISEEPKGAMIGGKSKYAYLFEWDEYYAPRTLYRLLEAGIRAKVATKPFQIKTAEGLKNFDYGTIFVPVGPQNGKAEEIYNLLKTGAEEDGLYIYAVNTGLTPKGMDLGSRRNLKNIRLPEVALLVGSGVSSYQAGATWFVFDQRFDMPVTLISQNQLDRADLHRYNVIVMPRGWYGPINDSRLERWVRNGGTLIAYNRAIKWADNNGFANLEFIKKATNKDNSDFIPYADLSKNDGEQEIGGSIFNVKLDLTHPLAYGYNRDTIKVFRGHEIFVKIADNPYATPVRYTDEPLASGYISDENLEKLRGTAAVIVTDLGDGKVITMTDNPNFRAIWFGTTKLFMNAVFFGNIISGASAN